MKVLSLLQDAAYFVGERLTWVDFLVFDVLESNVEFCHYTFGKNSVPTFEALEKFPKLNNFFRLMSRRLKLTKYLSSKRRFPYELPYVPKDLLL
jgi:hypothetical protein